MSLSAEYLHQQSLNVLAKLATSNKFEDETDIKRSILYCETKNKLKMNQNNTCIKTCALCMQINCGKSCEKENISKFNPEKQVGLETPQKSFFSSEPITPTANLKMLVCAASDLQPALPKLDEEKRRLFAANCEVEDHEDLATQKVKLKKGELMGRKEKSLGLLCKKFMSIYPEFSPLGTTIMLDDVVKSLSIGRRRVYDIVNVLESMEMMVRQAKNKYIWFGKSRLPATLSKLKALALRVYGSNFCHILKRFCHVIGKPKAKEPQKKNCFILPKDYNIKPLLMSPGKGQNSSVFNSNGFKVSTEIANSEQPKVDDRTNSIMDSIISYDLARRDCNRSLGILCQKFMMLFMVAENSIVSLDRAAKLLITEPEEGPGKYKTKVRRLYDIANILTSINFLEKCVSYEDAAKKAAYKWIGLDLKSINCEEDANKAFLSQEFSLTRHSLLTQAPRERYAFSSDPYKSHSAQRRLECRSASAHELTSPNHNPSSAKDINDMVSAKQARAFSVRTFSDTMVNHESNIEVQNDDGFDVENMEEGEDDTNDAGKEIATQLDSPNQVLFKEKLRSLQREFPDKLPGNGLLDLLSACKDNPKASRPSRRRLSSDFHSNHTIPLPKKTKVEESKIANPPNDVTNNASEVNTENVSSICNHVSSSNTLQSFKSLLSRNNPIVCANTTTDNDQNIVTNSENSNQHNSLNNGNWQQPTYFTIPATLKPVAKSGSPAQSITTMLVSPLSNPLSIPKSGLYQIIPVQCHPVTDGSDCSVLPTVQIPLIAKQPNTCADGVKLTSKVGGPVLMRGPVVTVTSPSVAISPTPCSLKNFTETTLAFQQLSEKYPEFITPPHVLYRHLNKPPANPIIFPKMTPETPSSTGQISQAVLTNVTRKLMALQKEDGI